MPDYQDNSNRAKETGATPPINPTKNLERVIVTDVIVKKKGIGRKFRDLFIEADFKTVIRHVASDVLLPAARNMILDASTTGVERMLYGDRVIRRRNFGSGPRVTYNTPPNRGGFGGSPLRHAPQTSPEPRISLIRQNRNDLILTTREEAELVLEKMNDIVEAYEVASVADLNELVGLSASHVDNKWGWSNLSGVQIRQIREGYLIDFPPAEPIQ